MPPPQRRGNKCDPLVLRNKNKEKTHRNSRSAREEIHRDKVKPGWGLSSRSLPRLYSPGPRLHTPGTESERAGWGGPGQGRLPAVLKVLRAPSRTVPPRATFFGLPGKNGKQQIPRPRLYPAHVSAWPTATPTGPAEYDSRPDCAPGSFKGSMMMMGPPHTPSL
ncbi:unnamed protein product [Pleuronectes platessa]|uniref:Uncharacterized protein n=1 Tax=Pleuronectes platessa TaxID=8262 RepID=A0A9N7Y926_PLEPL|nr:unnamed protein product [Pleuronectes platessa]